MLHGCKIGDGALIGMGSTILNNAIIGENSLIGAGSLVTEGNYPAKCFSIWSTREGYPSVNGSRNSQ